MLKIYLFRKKILSALKESQINPLAIRLWAGELGKSVHSTKESGEHPTIKVRLVDRPKFDVQEIELGLIAPPGERHYEEFGYLSSDPKTWVSIGQIYLDDKDAKKLGELLIEYADCIEKAGKGETTEEDVKEKQGSLSSFLMRKTKRITLKNGQVQSD